MLICFTAFRRLDKWGRNGNRITTITGLMNLWEMYRQFNLLIRFPRINKHSKTLILSGPKNGGAYIRSTALGIHIKYSQSDGNQMAFQISFNISKNRIGGFRKNRKFTFLG
jgi:hypothetical protein